MVFEKVRPSGPSADAPPPAAVPQRRRRLTAPIAAAVAAVCLALLVVALVRMTSPGSPFVLSPGLTAQYRPIAVGALMLAAAAVLVLLGWVRWPGTGAGRVSARMRSVAWWVFVAGCFAAQLALAHAVLRYTSWDAMQVFQAAYHQAVAPQPAWFSANDEAVYFSLYPNNYFLVAAFAGLFGVLKALGLQGPEQFLWVTVVVNGIALTASLVLVRVVLRRLAPGFATAAGVALGLVLVLVSPWLNVMYSDTLAMVFPIGMLALWVVWPARRSTRSRLLLFALLGVLAAAGVAIKPPVVFMAGALLLATALTGTARRLDLRAALPAAAALALGFGIAHLGIDAVGQAAFPAFGAGGAMPFTHFMAMGSTGDGGFNAQDFNRTWATPPADRAAASLGLWEERVLAMGPIGYPVFLAQKMLFAFSDGSFFQDREGVGTYDVSYFSNDPFSLAVQSVFPLGSPWHWLLASVWQAAWWCTVLLCLVPLRRLRLPRGGAVLAARVALVLLVAFLCISESRSRYLYHYLPVALVLAGLGAAAIRAEVGALRERLRPRAAVSADARSS
ncbi:hypothetical protein [uncultured Amnibacterium sp.]|uniref:hypothetical protein n=1 Tax=uncultured Amnibacterium sp. TaxID=1631851 RepID=UPI0035CC192E